MSNAFPPGWGAPPADGSRVPDPWSQNGRGFSETEVWVYGGFWVRLAAALIDGLIVAALGFVIGLFTGPSFIADGHLPSLSSNPHSYEVAYIAEAAESHAFGEMPFHFSFRWPIFIHLLLGVAYFAGLHASQWRATVGKKLLGLQVTDTDGARISLVRGVVRYVALNVASWGIFFSSYLEPVLPLAALGFIGIMPSANTINALLIGLSPRKRGYHDLIAGTIVIRQTHTALRR